MNAIFERRIVGAMALAFATASSASAQSLVDPDFNRCIDDASAKYEKAISDCGENFTNPRQIADCRTKATNRLSDAKRDCASASQKRATAKANAAARAAELRKRN